MTEVVLFHSILGLRPAVLQTAEQWRQAGHVVHTPDLHDGRVFGGYDDAFAFYEELGGDGELLRRTDAAVAGLATNIVYGGYSNGIKSVLHLVATRPGARGALAFHGALPMRAVGAQVWPSSVPLQVHEGELDPFREQELTDEFAEQVSSSGAAYQYFEYAGVAGHLFGDPDLSDEYDKDAAELMNERALAFLAGLDGTRPTQ